MLKTDLTLRAALSASLVCVRSQCVLDYDILRICHPAKYVTT